MKKIVKIPVKQEKGIALMNYINYEEFVKSPKAVGKIEHNSATTTIIRSRSKAIQIDIKEPFDTIPLDETKTDGHLQ